MSIDNFLDRVLGSKKSDYLNPETAGGERKKVKDNTDEGILILKPGPWRFKISRKIIAALRGEKKEISRKSQYELLIPYQPFLSEADSIRAFFEILSTPITNELLLSLNHQQINFLVHSGLLILEQQERLWEKGDQRSNFLHLPEQTLRNIRQLLTLIFQLNNQIEQETGQPKWYLNIPIPPNWENEQQAFFTLSDVSEVNDRLSESLFLLGENLETKQPRANYVMSTRQYILKQDLIGEVHDDGLHYSKAKNTARQATELLQRTNLTAKLRELEVAIEKVVANNGGVETTKFSLVHFSNEKYANFLNSLKRLKLDEAISQVLTFAQVKYILKSLPKAILSLDWDTNKYDGRVILEAFRDSVLQVTVGEKNKLSSNYQPIFFEQIPAVDIEQFSLELEDFIEDHHDQLKKEKKVKKIPAYKNWRYVTALVVFAATGVRSPIVGFTNEHRAEIIAILREIPELSLRLLDLFSEEPPIEEIPAVIREFIDEESLQYTGPQNTDIPLALRKLQEQDEPISLDSQRDFIGVMRPSYQVGTDTNPFQVTWPTRFDQNKQQFYSQELKPIEHDLEASLSNDTSDNNKGRLNDLMESDQLVVGAKVQILNAIYEVVEVAELDFSAKKQLSIEPPSNASVIIFSSNNDAQSSAIYMRDIKSLQELIKVNNASNSKTTIVFLDHTEGDHIDAFINTASINTTTSTNFFTAESDLEENSSVINHEVIEHLQNWGMDFSEMERVVSMPMIGTMVTQPRYSDTGDYEGASYGERTEFYPETIILERLVDEIKKQLLEKGVRYSTDISANKYMSSNDIRAQLLVAETVGLDCDGLSFIITMIADAFLKSVETIDIQGKYKMIDESGNPVIIHESNYATMSSNFQINATETFSDFMISIGELDTDSDSNFSGYINHARGSIKYNKNSWSQEVFTFESTDVFPVSNFASEEDYAELASGIEALGLENDIKSMEKTLLVMQILTIVMGATAVYIPTRKIASLIKENKQRKKRRKRLEELQAKDSKVNELVVSKVVSFVSGLNNIQISWIPQYLDLLLYAGEQYSGENRRLSIDQVVNSIKYMDTLGTHKPSLNQFTSVKSSLSYLFGLSRTGIDVTQARLATKLLLKDSEIPQENKQVIKIIDLLFKLRWS